MIVLPEIFGLNRWVRGVADRLSAAGVPALAVPLFARTAPDLELGYDPESTQEGRRHKEATSTEGILADVQAAIDWLRQALESHEQPLRITVVGFCFGGMRLYWPPPWRMCRSALIFMGQGELHCLCGSIDPLIPSSEQQPIQAALQRWIPQACACATAPLRALITASCAKPVISITRPQQRRDGDCF